MMKISLFIVALTTMVSGHGAVQHMSVVTRRAALIFFLLSCRSTGSAVGNGWQLATARLLGEWEIASNEGHTGPSLWQWQVRTVFVTLTRPLCQMHPCCST